MSKLYRFVELNYDNCHTKIFFALALLYFLQQKFLAQFLVGKFISPNHKNLLMAHNYFLLINQP